MNLVIKKAIKLISIYKKDGITISSLLKAMHDQFDQILDFKNDDFLKKLTTLDDIRLINHNTNEELKKDNLASSINKDNHRLIVAKYLQNQYLKQNLLNLYFKNDDEANNTNTNVNTTNNNNNNNTSTETHENDVIFKIYQEIAKAGPNGISYTTLSEIFSKKNKKGNKYEKQKLESYMISNYCCKLAKHNFIKIGFDNNSKIAFLKDYNAIDFGQVKKGINSNTNTNKIKSKDDDGPEIEPYPKKKRKYEITQQNILEKLDQETFCIREFTQKANILLNLQSYKSQVSDGITIKSLSKNIRMKHDKKPLDRILKNLTKQHNIQILAFRSGKSFSHKYLIRNPKVANIKYNTKLDKSITQSLKIEYEGQNPLQGNNQIQGQNQTKLINLPENIKEKNDISNTEISKLNVENNTNMKRNIDYNNNRLIIIPEVYQDIIDVLWKHECLVQKLEKNDKNYYKNIETMNLEEYIKNSENLLQILIENVDNIFPIAKSQQHQGSDKKATPAKNNFSKRALTRLKLNRYIYVLNKVKEKRIISNIDLKNLIINEIEGGSGWKIDRKTLRSILEVLEKYILIKIVDYKLSFTPIKEQNESGDMPEKNYIKTIILERNVDPSDPKIENDPAITNPTLRGDLNFPETLKEKEFFKDRVTKKAREKNNLKKKICAKINYDDYADLNKAKDGSNTNVSTYPLTESKSSQKDHIVDNNTTNEESKENLTKHDNDMILENKDDIFNKMKDELKKKKKEFDELPYAPLEKLKKIDFTACKLLGIEYKTMIFFIHLEIVFTDIKNRQLHWAFQYLKAMKTFTIVDHIKFQKKSMKNCLYNHIINLFKFIKYDNILLSDDDDANDDDINNNDNHNGDISRDGHDNSYYKPKLNNEIEYIDVHNPNTHELILKDIDSKIEAEESLDKEISTLLKDSFNDNYSIEKDIGLSELLNSVRYNDPNIITPNGNNNNHNHVTIGSNTTTTTARTNNSSTSTSTSSTITPNSIHNLITNKIRLFTNDEEKEKHTILMKRLAKKLLTFSIIKKNNLIPQNQYFSQEFNNIIENCLKCGIIDVKIIQYIQNDLNESYTENINYNDYYLMRHQDEINTNSNNEHGNKKNPTSADNIYIAYNLV